MKLKQFNVEDIEEELLEFACKVQSCKHRYNNMCMDGISNCNITECIKKGEFVSTQMRISNKNW